jgi:pimeloyl-ACP methyl ester carboxylesterase
MESPPPLGFFGLLCQALGSLELPRLAWHWPRLMDQRSGHGRPVLLFPGHGASDRSTWLLRYYLRCLGYQAQGWGLGRNHGNAVQLLPQVISRVSAFAESSGQRVRLIGWSMGGYLAREAARDRPDLVQCVVTLGTPTVGGPKYTTVAAHYRRQGIDLEAIEAQVAARNKVPLQVPVTAIYSCKDGVVLWQACVDHNTPQVRHFEVNTSHLGLGLSPDVFCLVACNLS